MVQRDAMDNDSIEQELQALKADYLAGLPETLREMRQLFVQIHRQPDSALIQKLQLLAHRIKGTAGTYGLAGVGDCATELEQSLAAVQNDTDLPWEALEGQVGALQRSIEQAASDRVAATGQVSAQAGAGRLLVVDDDPDFLRFMEAILRQRGFRVDTTTDPTAVLDLINAQQPELLLIDVDMPDIGGYELCQLLRNDAQARELPIIFLTAHDEKDYRIAAFRAGADDFINKPIVAEELMARVDVRLARARLVHEKQEVLSQLQSQHESLLAILNQLQIGTVMVDNTGKILFMSQSCGQLCGIGIEQAVGRLWHQVLPFGQKSLHDIERALHSQHTERPRLHFNWRRDGKQYFVESEIKEVPARPGLSLLFLYDQSELHQLRQQIERSRFHQMLGNSEPMRQMYDLIEQVARGNWNVLIEGETGVGKELVAHSIHAASPRKDGPFIAVNSAGLSETLLSSQLFGHRRGAFTGAVADQEGFFEAAAGGTLFLDEIGDIPLPMQAALLRVLQEKEIIRLGESRTRKVDVRIIAATHKDLASEVRAGRFREDLLYRLRVARVYVPALRERKADIPMLAQAFLAESCQSAHIAVKQVGQDAMRRLLAYDWPGNVRELKATVDYALIHCRTEELSSSDLPPEIGQATPVHTPPEPLPVHGDERSRILNALQKTGGNRSDAAKLLGIGRATFYRRLKALSIEI